MIIRCRKCGTRFRFDETVIEGDGVWVRCGRCQNVFFEERSSGETGVSHPSGEIPSVRISDAVRIGEASRSPEDRFPPAEDRPARGERETVSEPLPHRSEKNEELPGEIGKEQGIEGIEVRMDEEPLRGSAVSGDRGDEEYEEDEEEEEDEVPDAESAGRRWGRILLRIAALTVLIVLIAGGIALWLLPDVRTLVLEEASPWLRGIPGVEQFLGTDKKSGEMSQAPVRIKDVRQRSVTNLLVGNLRVIEGTAVNQSTAPLANIRIRLVISDAYDVVLGERVVYCGNLLTDAELNTLAEAEIQRELATSQGTDVPNQRIAPNGEIPFMIVFSQEQAGAIKTVVMPAGADRVP
ncbi:MAG: DUF3426 domain-containing protein [Syntrophales bacterium]